MKGTLIIVSAPSGAGKTSLLKALVAADPLLKISVSHTTRPMRSGEENGKDYYFIDQDAFVHMIGEGAFLEHAQVFDNYYGTAEIAVIEHLNQGHDVVLEIDWQGACQVRKRMPEAVSIFILPPNPQALHDRLSTRGQDTEEVIARRMGDAKSEMAHYPEYDYLVVNDDFKLALNDLHAIVTSLRLRHTVQSDRLQSRLNALLA
ncbi:Guanylate kinase [hydrothermal vent metagenome]|uniref:guanylate kinase n=1 Tax=hydrothermal vent metagenome TaxID=652676 RepID=A0A3B1BI29_9ZZZZ